MVATTSARSWLSAHLPENSGHIPGPSWKKVDGMEDRNSHKKDLYLDEPLLLLSTGHLGIGHPEFNLIGRKCNVFVICLLVHI